jgi:hypothetical protein
VGEHFKNKKFTSADLTNLKTANGNRSLFRENPLPLGARRASNQIYVELTTLSVRARVFSEAPPARGEHSRNSIY